MPISCRRRNTRRLVAPALVVGMIRVACAQEVEPVPVTPPAPTTAKASVAEADLAAREYREAARLLRAAFGDADGDVLLIPDQQSAIAIGEPLRAGLAKSSEARVAFARAAARASCRFARVGANPPFDEFSDLRLDLHSLVRWTAIEARRAIEDGEAPAAVVAMRTIFGFARHAYAEPSADGFVFAHLAEKAALDVAARLDGRPEATAVRELIGEYAQSRPGLEVLEASVRIEVFTFVDAVLEMAKASSAGGDADADRLRPIAREVRAEVDALMPEVVRIIDRAAQSQSADPFDEFEALVASWKSEIPKGDHSAIDRMPAQQRSRVLGRLLLLMTMPDVAGAGRAHLEIGGQLARRGATRR